ncbi:MAG: serine/threonine protein kinase [Phycisphaeraceae bacterium]|nr:serine/threonine protein kinase [Phycisphaeraceae bacterium]MCW5767798.1 serine/threonine protein kinase [Phycisphaeraceae bacterium]
MDVWTVTAIEPKKRGDSVEGYKILSEIGRGAASIIYVVQDVKSKQVWALKHVDRGDAKDARFLDQAESEYRIAQELNHPAIRKITRMFKKGTLLTTKELYLVMELVDGVSLDKAPPKNFEQAVDIFQQVADAMHHMHKRGYVHADMKPNNIVVADGGVVKIIDLGQGCKIGTVKPRIQGTPDYIAPEQVHRRPITPKTDIYNLGATMYWVFTRQHIPTALAKGDSLVNSLDDSLIQKPKPVVELNPRVHPKLSELIMSCVEVDADNRPESMALVADRLSLILGILRAKAEDVVRSMDQSERTDTD